jgi:PAS domain S-box-containing protein
MADIMEVFKNLWNKKTLELEERVQLLEKQLENAEFIISRINNENFELNKECDSGVLNGHLYELSLKMKEYAVREKQRAWVSDGLISIVDILRKDQSGKDELYQQILSSIVKYLNANQGGLFILTDDADQKELEMVASYAYGKKRFQEKKIKIGEGLLGQCFQEAETTVYSDIPPFYTTITSGMGEATPGCLILVPIKLNEQVLGVMEVAGFHMFQQYEIDFIEKIAESVASVCFNIKNTEKSRKMLVESELREQILKEQEEELRQNLEELVTTQEEMQRKQMELDQKSDMMKLIIDNIPFPVFVKDEIGRYTLVNKAEAALFNMSEEMILGKDDSHFVENEQEWKVIKESDLRTLDSDEPVELPVQSFTTSLGITHTFKTTKIPFVNSLNGKKNILGVSVDLTEKLDLEKKLLKEKIVSKNNLILDLAGRQRMLSQKIGFYSEMVVRGKNDHIEELKNAIELHNHSLNILKNGGTPKGIDTSQVIEEAGEYLLPYLVKVEEIWGKYKRAAENIIEARSKTEQPLELDKWIGIIEEKGELLLNANNDLLKAFYNKNKKILVDIA